MNNPIHFILSQQKEKYSQCSLISKDQFLEIFCELSKSDNRFNIDRDSVCELYDIVKEKQDHFVNFEGIEALVMQMLLSDSVQQNSVLENYCVQNLSVNAVEYLHDMFNLCKDERISVKEMKSNMKKIKYNLLVSEAEILQNIIDDIRDNENYVYQSQLNNLIKEVKYNMSSMQGSNREDCDLSTSENNLKKLRVESLYMLFQKLDQAKKVKDNRRKFQTVLDDIYNVAENLHKEIQDFEDKYLELQYQKRMQDIQTQNQEERVKILTEKTNILEDELQALQTENQASTNKLTQSIKSEEDLQNQLLGLAEIETKLRQLEEERELLRRDNEALKREKETLNERNALLLQIYKENQQLSGFPKGFFEAPLEQNRKETQKINEQIQNIDRMLDRENKTLQRRLEQFNKLLSAYRHQLAAKEELLEENNKNLFYFKQKYEEVKNENDLLQQSTQKKKARVPPIALNLLTLQKSNQKSGSKISFALSPLQKQANNTHNSSFFSSICSPKIAGFCNYSKDNIGGNVGNNICTNLCDSFESKSGIFGGGVDRAVVCEQNLLDSFTCSPRVLRFDSVRESLRGKNDSILSTSINMDGEFNSDMCGLAQEEKVPPLLKPNEKMNYIYSDSIFTLNELGQKLMKFFFSTDLYIRILATNLNCEEIVELGTLEKLVCWSDCDIMLGLEFRGGKHLKVLTYRKTELIEFLQVVFQKRKYKKYEMLIREDK